MKALSNSAICPKCGGGHKSRPYCEYDNGWHCFSCGYTKASDRTFAVRESRITQDNNPSFPELNDCLYYNNFSLQALKWFTQFHVTKELCYKYNIMQHPDGSIIYPNISDGTLISYQRRWLGGERRITTKGAKKPSFFPHENSDNIVICEDFISAIRIAEIENSLCLWGTKLDWGTIKSVVDKYDNFYVWLDNDCSKSVNSGQEAAQVICKMLENAIHYKNRKRFSHTQSVRNVVTEKDPKYYVNSEIKEKLCY